MDGAEGWLAYKANPDGPRLARAVVAAGLDGRATLIHAVEDLFFESRDWRVGQHAAMLHLDRFAPQLGQVDIVKALYFASEACQKSQDDPRARIVLALVSWERRLPLAVLYDVERALSRRHVLIDLADRQQQAIIGQAYALRGLAYAYLSDVDRSIEALKEAEFRGTLAIDGVVRLLLASAHRQRWDTEGWAAARIPFHAPLGGQAAAIFLRALRRKLLILLTRRDLGRPNQ